MLQSIYTSQFYKHSKRKKRITAAVAEPSNQGLVMQLAEALDEEYQDPKYLLDKDDTTKLEDGLDPDHASAEEKPEAPKKDKLDDSKRVSDTPNMSKLKSKPNSEAKPEAPKPDEAEKPESKPENKPASEQKPASESKPVEESTQLSKDGQSILAATQSYLKDFHQLCDQIKGLLNLNGSTSGVSRVLVKADELQIFYDDSINLNEVMSEVIEMLNAAGYTYLEFNRLMRSSNAIVFVINGKDTNNTVKPRNFSEEIEAE